MINYTIETLKGFKSYEWTSLASFLSLAILWGFNGMWVPMVVAICAKMWVFISSAYRQMALNE